jgi:hypothetical protein
LGGIPSTIPDVPVSAVLLALFVGSAATHMTIFQLNLRREHKFIFSAMLFGFSMARIVALIMRIVWATHQTNVNVAIAPTIFTAAGVLLLFVVNLIFTRRVIRAYHPRVGWHAALDIGFKVIVVSVIATLIIVITATVQSYFTLDTVIRQRDREMQLFAGTYLALLAFLPIPIIAITVLLPRTDDRRVDKFGSGRFRSKIFLLLFTSTLLTFGACWRVGVSYTTPRVYTQPAWYHNKGAYYVVNFVIELIVVYTYAIARFDRRFHVPDGSKGGYSGVNREEEVFGPGETSDELNSSITDVLGADSGNESGRELGSLEKDRVIEAAV